MMTADGSIILLEFTLEGTDPKVKISRPQINQVSVPFWEFLACFDQHDIVKLEFRLTKIQGLLSLNWFVFISKRASARNHFNNHHTYGGIYQDYPFI